MRSALRLAIASRTPWPHLFKVECSQPPLGGRRESVSISVPMRDPFHLQLPLSDLLETRTLGPGLSGTAAGMLNHWITRSTTVRQHDGSAIEQG